MANRFDVGMVTIAPQKDNNGFLTVDATPTRAGIFIYHEMDSTGKINQVRELRHPDEVFRQDTLESLKGIPYTIQKNHVALINPNDAQFKSFGFTRDNARQEGNHSRVSIKITHGGEIDTILGVGKDSKGNQRKKMDSLELSNGYTCDVVKESGEYNGEKYDAKQTNILYNHVARVDNARGGDTCRIRLDSKCAICGIDAERIDSDDVSKTKDGESIMKMIQLELPKVVVGDLKLDADDVEFPDEHKGVVGQFKKREKSLITALEGVSEKLDSANQDIEGLQGNVATLEKQNEDLKTANGEMIPAADIMSAARKFSKLHAMAGGFKMDMADVEKMESEHEIMKAINIKTGQVKEEDVKRLDNEDFNAGVFSRIDVEYEKKKLDSKDNLENHSVTFKPDGEESEFDKAKRNRRA